MFCEYECGNEATHIFKNGKKCCSVNIQQCPAVRLKNSKTVKESYRNGRRNQFPILKNKKCDFCKREISIANIKRHIELCYLNPKNLRSCPVCKKPIKHPGTITCSRKCRLVYCGPPNKFPNNKLKAYTSICFRFHKKECIICGEKNIVAVHHFDLNNKNNDPVNLVPMCPTHHIYLHSRYKNLIINKVLVYREKFKTNYFKEYQSVMWE
jgi:hypothetical protein